MEKGSPSAKGRRVNLRRNATLGGNLKTRRENGHNESEVLGKDDRGNSGRTEECPQEGDRCKGKRVPQGRALKGREESPKGKGLRETVSKRRANMKAPKTDQRKKRGYRDKKESFHKKRRGAGLRKNTGGNPEKETRGTNAVIVSTPGNNSWEGGPVRKRGTIWKSLKEAFRKTSLGSIRKESELKKKTLKKGKSEFRQKRVGLEKSRR